MSLQARAIPCNHVGPDGSHCHRECRARSARGAHGARTEIPVFAGETRSKYNDGHGVIRGQGEHPFAALHTWAVGRDVCHKLGINWEEIITRLHQLIKLNPPKF